MTRGCVRPALCGERRLEFRHCGCVRPALCGERRLGLRGRRGVRVERRLELRDGIGASPALCGELRRRGCVRPALRGERRLELAQAPLEAGGVAAHARERRAHAGELLGDGGELVGCACTHRGGVGRGALVRERHLLRRLRARRSSLGLASFDGGKRPRELRLAVRVLLLEQPDTTFLLAQARERDGIGGPQQLALAQAPALLVELTAQPLRRRERSGQLVRRRERRDGRLRDARCIRDPRRLCRVIAGGGRLRDAATRRILDGERSRKIVARRLLHGRSTRLERLQPPLELRAAELEHLDRLERLGSARRRGSLGRLRATYAALGHHGAIDDLAARLLRGSIAVGDCGGSKPRLGAGSAARAPLSQDSESSSGSGSISAAGTR